MPNAKIAEPRGVGAVSDEGEVLPSTKLTALTQLSWTPGRVSSETLARVFHPQTTRTGQTVFMAVVNAAVSLESWVSDAVTKISVPFRWSMGNSVTCGQALVWRYEGGG